MKMLNPFSGMTTILFTLPEDTYVALRVFDMYGIEIDVLLIKTLPWGMHLVEFHSGNLNPGNYIYHIETSRTTLVRKMVIVE